jgi:hypothetical protein
VPDPKYKSALALPGPGPKQGDSREYAFPEQLEVPDPKYKSALALPGYGKHGASHPFQHPKIHIYQDG